MMRAKANVLYWGAAGALAGFGSVGLMTIGLPFLLAGAAMALIGLLWVLVSTVLDLLGPLQQVDDPRRFLGGLARRLDGTWALPVAFGVLPALVITANLLVDASRVTWSCSSISFGNEAGGHGYIAPGGEEVVCQTFPGSFITIALVFWGIAMLGCALRLATRRLRTST
jgi:hypothetical protein